MTSGLRPSQPLHALKWLRPTFRRPPSAASHSIETKDPARREILDRDFFTRNERLRLTAQQPHPRRTAGSMHYRWKDEDDNAMRVTPDGEQVPPHSKPKSRWDQQQPEHGSSQNASASTSPSSSPGSTTRDRKGSAATRATRQGGQRQFSTSTQAHSAQASSDRHGSSSRYHAPGHYQYGGRNTRTASLQPVTIRSRPRKSYDVIAEEDPEVYSLSPSQAPPLPLLILDLNGTLVWRGNARSNNSSPIRRPYLSSFLAYCLGIEDASYGDRHHLEEEAANRRRSHWNSIDRKLGSPADASRTSAGFHGVHVWYYGQAANEDYRLGQQLYEIEPPAHPKASCRLLVWSSAQPHNVDTMIRSILHPEQAGQLLRSWGRDTLVPSRFYGLKFPSVKDLEIVWNALNISLHGDTVPETAWEGEDRVLAEYRDEQDRRNPDQDEIDSADEQERGAAQDQVKSSSHAACLASSSLVTRPTKAADGKWEPGRGFGPHNTLLIDDSPDKARLQPYNHLCVPEFGARQANVAERERNRLRAAHKGQQEVKLSEELDTVLLQTIGVLEHARHQTNIAAWIRSGGLGYYAGQSLFDSALSSSFFAKADSAREVAEEVGLRFNEPIPERTQKFWEQEGRAALERHKIAIVL